MDQTFPTFLCLLLLRSYVICFSSVLVWILPDFNHVTLFPNKKAVLSIAWHPDSTSTDTEFSKCCNWIATSGNETIIKVFDLSRVPQGINHTVLTILYN